MSLDLITDAVWGDATRPATKQFWRQAADDGLVHGLLAGPPCESWSQARFVQTGTGSGPGPIRSADFLWGAGISEFAGVGPSDDWERLAVFRVRPVTSSLLCARIWRD